jgi:hypothetical protein
MSPRAGPNLLRRARVAICQTPVGAKNGRPTPFGRHCPFLAARLSPLQAAGAGPRAHRNHRVRRCSHNCGRAHHQHGQRLGQDAASGFAALHDHQLCLQGMTHQLTMDGRKYRIVASIIHPGATLSSFSTRRGRTTAGPGATPDDYVMAAEDVAKVAVLMCALPPEVNLYEATYSPTTCARSSAAGGKQAWQYSRRFGSHRVIPEIE